MNAIKALLILLFAFSACSQQSHKDQKHMKLSDGLVCIDCKWVLKSPEATGDCELSLTFSDKDINVKFLHGVMWGPYTIDSVLTNYITFNISPKVTWSNDCPFNREYLSFYDLDTQFSYKILDDRLYFQKNEKEIIFERVLLSDSDLKN